jgi:hypothetical protein
LAEVLQVDEGTAEHRSDDGRMNENLNGYGTPCLDLIESAAGLSKPIVDLNRPTQAVEVRDDLSIVGCTRYGSPEGTITLRSLHIHEASANFSSWCTQTNINIKRPTPFRG